VTGNVDQVARAKRFSAAHVRGNPLILYNAWDVGSAKAVAAAGIKFSLVASQAREAALSARTSDQVVRTAGMAGLFAVLVALGLGLVISRSITRPLGEAVQMVQEMGQGRLDRRRRWNRSRGLIGGYRTDGAGHPHTGER
jgi:methyl-accepting chemotaxis protein